MTLIDTHIWIWWVDQNPNLSPARSRLMGSLQATGIGVSAISCWEVAKLVELGRLSFSIPVLDWLNNALLYPGIQLIGLSPEIAVESTQLPAPFHRDPADQILVATARVLGVDLVTDDVKIQSYAHVTAI